MNVTRRLAVLTFLLMSFGLLAQTVARKSKVEVEFDNGADFSRYLSYDWLKPKEPASNSADHIRIVKAVHKKMAERGFYLDTVEPDVRLRYGLEARSKLEGHSSQKESVWDPTDLETKILVERYNEASLRLEMFDSETNGLLWRAECTHVEDPPDKAEQSINGTVARIFSKYPGETKAK